MRKSIIPALTSLMVFWSSGYISGEEPQFSTEASEVNRRGGNFNKPKVGAAWEFTVQYLNRNLGPGDFSFLKKVENLRLDLRCCHWEGPVLQELNKLANLIDLDLSNTLVTDEDIANLSSSGLIRLRIENTNVTEAGLARIPYNIQAQLKLLDVAGTPIADWDNAKLKFERLEELNLSRTKVSDRWLKSLPANLKILQLSATSVSVAGLQDLGKCLPGLIDLHLADNNESKNNVKNLGEWLHYFSKLGTLNLANTGVTDSDLPINLRQTNLEKSLVSLDLSKCKISDEGIKRIHGLTSLRRLSLANCFTEGDDKGNKKKGITNVGVAYLKTLVKLEELDLSRAFVNDAGIENLGGLPLAKLYLAGTGVKGMFVKEQKLLKLTELDLSSSPVNIAGLGAISLLPELKTLILSDNDVTMNSATINWFSALYANPNTRKSEIQNWWSLVMQPYWTPASSTNIKSPQRDVPTIRSAR